MSARSDFRELRSALESANRALSAPHTENAARHAIADFRRAASAAAALERSGAMARLARTLSTPEHAMTKNVSMTDYRVEARRAIVDLVKQPPGDLPELYPLRVILVVAEVYDLDADTLRGPVRWRNVTEARQLAMLLTAALTEVSLARIGDALGGRDHTTVLHGIRRAAERLDADDSAALAAADVLHRLGYARTDDAETA